MSSNTPTSRNDAEGADSRLEAFAEQPENVDLYRELKAALRKRSDKPGLATLYELRAPQEKDSVRAAAMWADAGEIRFDHDDIERAEQDLHRALRLDPGNERAAGKLAEHLLANRRFADAAQVLESELDELEQRASKAPPTQKGGRLPTKEPFANRRAQRHRVLAQIWDERLGRVERALHHWQRAWQLEPHRGEALEAARAIYSSLGDEAMVARLYEAELEMLGEGGPRPRRAQVELELGRIHARRGDTMAAANHLEVALRLNNRSIEAREALAEIYSSPSFESKQDRQRRASELFVDLGRRRLATKDEDEAISYLRRALGVDPYCQAGTTVLEKALTIAERWDELDRLYKHRATLSEEASERIDLLTKRARLYEQKLDDRPALKKVLAELAAAHPPGNKFSKHLRNMYRLDEDWTELATLIEHELNPFENDPAQAEHLCQELLELATIIREHLGERDRAAENLHRVLSIDPYNEEALARYGDHFRERRDWRGLADLLEFALDNARDAGATPSQLVRRLEELALIAETRLGDVDRAIATWGRIQQMEPNNPKAREALRRLMSRAKMWESLVGVLEQEAQGARSPRERADALRRIAQVYRERQVNPRRAIALYEEVLTLFPDDSGALKALSELYERESDDRGLANTLRRQLELDVRRMMGKPDPERRAPTAREWPVAKRVERLTSLRRLATMCEQRLADVEGVVFACTGILEILPGDRDALDRMEAVLDKAGDIPRLEQTLEYHASSAKGPAERAKVLRRMARIAADRDDEAVSMERWEQVLKAAPNDADALAALADLYERHSRWGELAAVLERTLMTQKASEDDDTRATARRPVELMRYARVVDQRLGDSSRAMRAWSEVLESLPHDREALEALARLYQDAGRWRDLAEVLALQAPLYIDDEPESAATVALKRADLLEHRLGAPAEAIKALEAVLSDLDPANVDAHQALRRLYEARGDFEAAVRIAEREMYLTEDIKHKIVRGLEIGLLCRDRLSDPTRALQAFVRVLELQPDHEEALTAAADLYAKVGDWHAHVGTIERRIELSPEGRDRRALMMRAAQVTAERMHDYKGAFAWYRKAHEHAPDASTIAELRRAAEAYSLWRDLADVYEAERTQLLDQRSRPADVEAYVAASRELAAIAEHRLNNRQQAMTVLLDAVTADPLNEGLLSEAERIAVEANQRILWKLLLDCFEASLVASDRERRVALRSRRARILEERLEDARGAVEELLTAFSYLPDREETRHALYELAERTGSWSDVIAVESALFELAEATPAQIDILRRRAQVDEDKAGDHVRAFRTHLLALLLDPENAETVSHLWRLARDIGEYQPDQRRPQPEPQPAHVAADDDDIGVHARELAPIHVGASKKVRGEPTEELSFDDVLDPETNPGVELPRQDRTMPIDISELEIAEDDDLGDDLLLDPPAPGNSPVEMKSDALLAQLSGREPWPQPSRPPEPPQRGKGPPPPPPRPPKIERKARAGKRRPTTRSARKRLPALTRREFVSPWEELATTYKALPAPDKSAKLRWLFRAAEVWETGAGDIAKAFDILAMALETEPDDAEPRARLHRLAQEHDEWDRLAGLYEDAAEEAVTADAVVGLFLEVAEIRARQKRPAETESLYRRILGIRPEETAVREKLETLYRGEKRWVDLAASLEERTDPRLGTAAPEPERPALLRELASVYADRLSRPRDALEALVRLRDLAPEDIDVLRSLAELYGQVGRWSQVIEMLGRIAEIAAGTNEAREAGRQIAKIYETELELPDRAIDSYSLLLSSWPDDTEAYAALDRLYEAHARWEDLSDILRRRAALSRDPSERAALLRRRANVLMEWLEAPEEAAAALRHARTITPNDDDLADDLVRALVRAEREREASAILEGRIAAMRADNAGEGDIAALLIRLATLRAEQLSDPEGAQAMLDEALELVPDHPTALGALARLAEASEDPSAYAAARLREAEARQDVESKVEAYMAAGVTLAERCDDIDGARKAFEAVLELRSYHAEATWALAGLVEQGGDLESASALLETRLEDDSLDAEEKVKLLTQMAALARRAGVDVAAERRLTEALAIIPNHLPAVIARADLLYEFERFEDLELFLQEAIPGLEDAPAAARAELQRRLAIAFEKLDRTQDAYQTLLAADRLHRGNLLVKLALGENRYRARRWREAALHLSATADHDEAENHASEVAEGLYHAALAEIRSLRPDKARTLYQRALELKPDYAPALHALAELAMEQGDHTMAADLLTRQAEATLDPAERMRLFEALGDMAVMTLNDEKRAGDCYAKAVAAADPLEAKHLPLLEKLLERQDLASDNLGAARTAELMASFGQDPRARAARYTAAAESYMAAGEYERARAAAQRAIESDPYHVTGVTVLSELMMRDEDYDDVAETLGRALSGEAAADELSAARRALLWSRLGEARAARGDQKGAISAFEKAVTVAADSDGAMAARRSLIDLWQASGNTGKREAILEYRRELAADRIELPEVVTYAKALCDAEEITAAVAMLDLAEALGYTLTEKDRSFLAAHPWRTMSADKPYQGYIDGQDYMALIRDDADSPMADLLATMWSAAALLWSEPADALERCGVFGAQRISANSHIAAASIFPRVAAALDIPATILYTTDVPDAADIEVVCVSAPLVILGPRFQGLDAADWSDLELRFMLGRAAELARPERVIATGLPHADFLDLLGSIKRVFGPPGLAEETDDEASGYRDEMLRTALPIKTRRQIKELLADLSPRDLDPDRFISACHRAADRAGYLVCGNIAAALKHTRETVTGHIIGMTLEPRYLTALAKLGLGAS